MSLISVISNLASFEKMQQHAVFLTRTVPKFLSIRRVFTLPATKKQQPITKIAAERQYCHQCLNRVN